MATKVSDLWARAVNRFEEESRRALENLRKNTERARSRADLERMLREAYERIERSITFPSPDELDALAIRIEALSKQLEAIEDRHGIPRKKKKKKAGKKTAKKKSAKKKKKKAGKKKKKKKKKKKATSKKAAKKKSTKKKKKKKSASS